MVAEYHYDYPVLTSKQAKVLRICTSWATPGDVANKLLVSVGNVLNMLVMLAANGFLETSPDIFKGKVCYILTGKGKRALKAHDVAVKAYNK